MRLVDIEPIVELVKGEHEKVQNRFSEANVFKEPNDVALWGAVLQEVGAFIGLMINAPTADAIPIEWLWKHMITHDEVVNGDYSVDEALELNLYVSDLIEKWCAERKDEYVTLHHDDIHFVDEDAERAFYEALTERKEE